MHFYSNESVTVRALRLPDGTRLLLKEHGRGGLLMSATDADVLEKALKQQTIVATQSIRVHCIKEIINHLMNELEVANEINKQEEDVKELDALANKCEEIKKDM